ncbi:histone deacetylase [Acinetobacter haemolyticus]|uniref:histone deacetylase n=1 Tax=Acinetobacter haemolyticus TaxID=29430 RepID=UPI000E57B8A8|nr:histone deacetylase [Acinetobacter haemolyticus]NAR49224.1 histone deacetylase [Acinetobacter haemolyticus]NAR57390.1 histone deacetylase [Acinetobacter haemolyticus]NAR80025.1 histone deacetylase [Acinetobacter haemolyticus]NAR96055.1 histone deacetylase [Acinetobacter haemolyticus]NAS02988.1 histone deacetylase [Acinetobacter haemolyticus]
MLKACYSPRYYAQTHTNSMEKLTAVAEVLQQQQWVELIDPGLIEIEILKKLHNPQYVDAFFAGDSSFATVQGFKPWNPQLRDAILSVQAGQLVGAEIALKEGIAANIAQGFHHASYDSGAAYCTFNGLALIAKQFPDKRIFILDCDQHGGDGTAIFTNRMPNLINFGIFGIRFGCKAGERSLTRYIHPKQGNFDLYREAILEAFQYASCWDADLIVYQAGMDCHQHDKYGSKWFTTALLFERDRIVFEMAKKMKIPLLFVLAGGYQPLEDLVPLHVNTFKAAHQIYFAEV